MNNHLARLILWQSWCFLIWKKARRKYLCLKCFSAYLFFGKVNVYPIKTNLFAVFNFNNFFNIQWSISIHDNYSLCNNTIHFMFQNLHHCIALLWINNLSDKVYSDSKLIIIISGLVEQLLENKAAPDFLANWDVKCNFLWPLVSVVGWMSRSVGWWSVCHYFLKAQEVTPKYFLVP